MAATETTEVRRGPWQTAYDDALTAALRKWAEDHSGDLAEQIEVFTKQASGEGWYGFESPFSYALRWRAEDILKAEVSTWVARYIVALVDGDEYTTQVGSPQEVLELVSKALQTPQAEGLHPSSSSPMANTLSTMRGYAAYSFGSVFDGLERLRWEAHFAAMKVVEGAVKGRDDARKQVREAQAALERTRSESGREREQRKLDAAEENLTAALNLLKVELALMGAPSDVVESETQRYSRW